MKNVALAELILDVYRGKGSKIGGVEYIITETPKVRFLSIGGSEGWQDWVMNARFIPVYSPTLGWVHAGFWYGARKMFNKEKKLLLDGKPTIVQGHSKGAGEAVDVAALMVKAGQPPVGMALFGAPRSGFKGLGEILANIPKIRPVNDGDVVDNVPPKGFILRYRHVCPETKTDPKFKGHSMSIYRDAAEIMPPFFK